MARRTRSRISRVVVTGLPVRYFLPLFVFALLLIASVAACGSDDGGSEAAASEFGIDGDTLTWAPPWEEGDARTVTVTSAIELSPALKAEAESSDSVGGGFDSVADEQETTLGTVTIRSVSEPGSKAELVLAVESLLEQLLSQVANAPDSNGDAAGMATLAMGFISQLDLGIDFDVDGSGAITRVTNLEELAAEVKTLVDLVVKFAALSEGEGMDPATLGKINSAFAELPNTAAAQVVAKSMVEGATANLFLMRSGEYKVGQPVAFAGSTSVFGLNTDGNTTYEVTNITSDAVTLLVKVTPGDVDILAMVEQFANEISPIIGEDSTDFIAEITELGTTERDSVSAVTDILFAPYTVTLTLDPETGWVTSADWNVTLTATESLLSGHSGDDSSLDGVDPADLWVTMHMHVDFVEVSATAGE